MRKLMILFVSIIFFNVTVYGEIADKAEIMIAYKLQAKLFNALDEKSDYINLVNPQKRYKIKPGKYKADILVLKNNKTMESLEFKIDAGNAYLLTLKKQGKGKLNSVLLKHGWCYDYFDTGRVHNRFKYKYGKKQGLSKEYNKTGKLKFIRIYENNILTMQEVLDKKGKIESINYYNEKGVLKKKFVRTRSGGLKKEYEIEDVKRSVKPKKLKKLKYYVSRMQKKKTGYNLDYASIIKEIKLVSPLPAKNTARHLTQQEIQSNSNLIINDNIILSLKQPDNHYNKTAK